MARQDIYGTIGDDVMGKTGHTSSLRGKIKCIRVWINTDVAGDAHISFCFDKENKNVILTGDMPRKWISNVILKDVV